MNVASDAALDELGRSCHAGPLLSLRRRLLDTPGGKRRSPNRTGAGSVGRRGLASSTAGPGACATACPFPNSTRTCTGPRERVRTFLERGGDLREARFELAGSPAARRSLTARFRTRHGRDPSPAELDAAVDALRNPAP